MCVRACVHARMQRNHGAQSETVEATDASGKAGEGGRGQGLWHPGDGVSWREQQPLCGTRNKGAKDRCSRKQQIRDLRFLLIQYPLPPFFSHPLPLRSPPSRRLGHEARSKKEDIIWKWKVKGQLLGFPGGTVVESPPADAGDAGSCPSPGHAAERLGREPWPLGLRVRSLCSTAGEAAEVRGISPDICHLHTHN